MPNIFHEPDYPAYPLDPIYEKIARIRAKEIADSIKNSLDSICYRVLKEKHAKDNGGSRQRS